jgi:hypothetical protein
MQEDTHMQAEAGMQVNTKILDYQDARRRGQTGEMRTLEQKKEGTGRGTYQRTHVYKTTTTAWFTGRTW